MATINTIQGSLNFCAAFILNRPPMNVAGNYQEPALTLANLIMSTILGPPFAWQWNRATTTFDATEEAGTDYQESIPTFGWLERATVTDSDGNVTEIAVVTSLATDGNQSLPFQICPIYDDNAGNITFRLMPAPDQDYTVTLTYQQAPIPVTSLYAASVGSITSIAASTGLTSVYNATGGITGYAALVGTYVWVSGATNSLNNGLFLVTASSSTSVTLQNPNGQTQSGSGGIIQPAVTWAPIPDKYNFLYNRGMLAHLHGMYDNQSYLMELQLFIRQLVGCSEGLSDTAKAIFLEDRLAQIRTAAASQAGNTASPKRAV
jgi:hypothetical protein